MRSRPPASSISPLRSCQSWASWRSPPDTRPVLSAFSTMNGEKTASETKNAPAAVSAPGALVPNARAPSQPTPWSTRAAPRPPSTQAAAVVTIR